MTLLIPSKPNSVDRQRKYARSGISLTELLISMFILLFGLLGVAAMFPVGAHYTVRGDRLDRVGAVGHAAAADAVTRGYLRRELWFVPNTGNNPDYFTNRNFPYNVPGLAIDPLGVYQALLGDSNPYAANYFPAPPPGTTADPARWPMRRVTLPVSTEPLQVMANWRAELAVAELAFTCRDDLAFEIPDSGDAPLKINYEKDGSGNTLRRSWNGGYSWLVTIGPAYDKNGEIATGDPSLDHEVSFVIFHSRTLLFPQTAPTDYDEREVEVAIESPGYGGGEVRLVSTGAPDELKGIRQGEWLLLYGLDPNTADLHPRYRKWFMHWYQMVATDRELEDIQTDRYVTLKGPDWPWDPADPNLSNYHIRAGLFRGAIAVYTKTMRLGGDSLWTSP